MTVNIRGKQYSTVAERVKAFRGDDASRSITTEMLFVDGESVRFLATIADASGRVLATGHAEEWRADGKINQSAAVENCETSAVGRALAFLGYAGDASLASADEVDGAQGRANRRSQPQGETPAQEALRLLKERFSGEDAAAAWLDQFGLSLADVGRRPDEVLTRLRGQA